MMFNEDGERLQGTCHDYDWMFDSITLYEDLHMYELQHPSPVLEWVDDHHVCIACHLPGGRTEIQELSLPLKLLAKEAKSLSKDRDFKLVSGGFHAGYVTDVKHIEGERKIVTSESGSNSVLLWTLGDGSSGSLIQKVHTFTNTCPQIQQDHNAVLAVNSSQLAFGSSVNDICLADIPRQQLVFSTTTVSSTPSPSLIGLHFREPSVLLIGFKRSLKLSLIDTRIKPQQEEMFPSDPNQCYDFCVDGDAVYQISSSLQLSVCDLRKPAQVVAQHDLEHQPTSTQGSLHIKTSPTQRDHLSISGADGNVKLFHKENWRQNSTSSLAPYFSHRGHGADDPEVKVTCHTWHPSVPRLLLSCAQDGSLHAWKHNK